MLPRARCSAGRRCGHTHHSPSRRNRIDPLPDPQESLAARTRSERGIPGRLRSRMRSLSIEFCRSPYLAAAGARPGRPNSGERDFLVPRTFWGSCGCPHGGLAHLSGMVRTYALRENGLCIFSRSNRALCRHGYPCTFWPELRFALRRVHDARNLTPPRLVLVRLVAPPQPGYDDLGDSARLNRQSPCPDALRSGYSRP